MKNAHIFYFIAALLFAFALAGSVIASHYASGHRFDPDAQSTVKRIDLNTADATLLQKIPGIGPVTAQKIIEYRDSHGPFTRYEDLLQIDGIGYATLSDIVTHASIGE